MLPTHHFDIGYDVVGVEADLVVSLGLVVIQGDGSDASPTLFTSFTTIQFCIITNFLNFRTSTPRSLLIWILIGIIFHEPSSSRSGLFVLVLVSVFLDISSPCKRFLLWVFVQVILLVT